LKRNLPLSGIDVRIIPRFKDPNGIEISAKKVRTSFIKGDIEELKLLVPESTIEVLTERYYIEDKSIKRKVLK
jgi:citrate lyase synthetase